MFTLRSRIALAALAVPATLAAAPAVAGLSFQPESRVWVEGTSTVRSYRCTATRVEGTITTDAATIEAVAADPDGTVRRAVVTIPVQSLDCANGTMNGHLRKALRAQEAPTIRFRLNDVAEKAGAGAVKLGGTLSIAGKENPAAIDATVSRDEQGRLRVKGSKPLRMTEFGVTPPSLMMGTMKVHDPVVVGFDVLLKN